MYILCAHFPSNIQVIILQDSRKHNKILQNITEIGVILTTTNTGIICQRRSSLATIIQRAYKQSKHLLLLLVTTPLSTTSSYNTSFLLLGLAIRNRSPRACCASRDGGGGDGRGPCPSPCPCPCRPSRPCPP